MPYCPLKLMATRIADGLSRQTSQSNLPPMLKLPGSYDSADECDKEGCGFWAVASEACGIAAGGSAALQPVPPVKDDKKDADLLKPQTTA
jgi:hypothetical protein